MSGLKQVFILIACISVATIAQYLDDSDYDDEAYDELLSHKPMRKHSLKEVEPVQDDFYMINDYEERMPQNNMYSANDDIDMILANDDGSIEMIKPPFQQLKWFQVPEKVYQYTKHRIPGYDYDELDFMGGRRFNKCDSRSVWSHCVCQFTCSNPNEVDCFMPCMSGCECKEAFVFDESAQRCIPPDMCPMQQGMNVYEK